MLSENDYKILNKKFEEVIEIFNECVELKESDINKIKIQLMLSSNIILSLIMSLYDNLYSLNSKEIIKEIILDIKDDFMRDLDEIITKKIKYIIKQQIMH
jgi:hypothetical protein